MSKISLFDELTKNAFDFLEQAFREFQEKPKYSVIHFCTAIELILKARLMHEHWSLIVDGQPNIHQFKEGNFKSVNFKSLIPKIENILAERISPETKMCFDKIADHRNKMVHFFHSANDSTNKKIITEIVIEQSAGWFYLHRLLEKWSPIFKKYQDRISELNSMMKGHKVYLSTVFDKIKPEINDDIKKGRSMEIASVVHLRRAKSAC